MNKSNQPKGARFFLICFTSGLRLRTAVRAFVCLMVPGLLLAAGPLAAQAPGTGAIAGSVSDPSGAVIPQAHVKVVSEETESSREASTTAEGFFRIPLLPPGDYSLEVAASGFQAKVLRSIHVTVTETAVVNVRLEVGTVSAVKIDVHGSPEMAQVESSALGQVTDANTIVSVPLANRNFTQILALNPGVIVEVPNAGALGKAQSNQNVSANGAKTTSNNFQFNGVDANNLSENSASGYQAEVGLAIPAPDTIEEFKVQTGMFDASYGRGAGANIDIVSKTGSNRFHGGVWEFFRNDALNANDYFLKQSEMQQGTDNKSPVLKQNQFGGELGGPLVKNRTFFFTSYQGTTMRNGVSSTAEATSFLPALTNDRSAAALGQAFGGQSGLLGGVAIAPDGSNINPVALALLNFKFPNGSYAIPSPPSGSGELTYSIPANYREDQISVNLDHNVSAKNQLAGRYFYSRAPFNEPFSPFGANLPGWGTSETDRNHMFVLSDTHAFSSNLINVARFGFMRFDGLASIAQPIKAADVGMATPGPLPEIPGIEVNGLFTIGTGGQPFYSENTNSFIWQDTISLTRGRHNLRFGGEAKRHELVLNVPFVDDGFLFFLSFPDFLLGQSAAQNGSPDSNVFNSVGAAGNFRKDQRYTDLASFVQDDIKVNARLTLNAGLRYEFFGPASDIHGNLPTFDPAIATAQVPVGGSFSGYVLPANYTGVLPAGVVKSDTSGLWNKDYKNFAPRVGFALRVFNRPTVVLRGGYGIYYDQLSGDLVEQTVGQPPFAFTQSFSGAQNGAATFQQPYVPALPPDSSFPIFLPRTPPPPCTGALCNGQGGGLTFFAVGRHLTSPYVQQYDLNVQYEFAPDFLWQVGYVGSKTTHQAGCTQFNQALLATPQNPVNGQTTSTVENLAYRVPFEGIAGGSFICRTTFDSNYNSLQSSVTHRLSHGLEFQASYTFSKNLDYTSGSGSLSNFLLSFLTNDQTNPRQARGLNDFDRRHRFVLSSAYSPPQLRAGPGVLRHALSSWQLSGESVLQSGLPLTAIDSTAGLIYGNLSGFSRAQCTGANPASAGPLSARLNGYFNVAAFAPPPVIGDGTGFGSCGVGILRGPSQLNLDLAIQRNFAITEGSGLQVRAEFFNFTNTPKFGKPSSDFAGGETCNAGVCTLNNPSFGIISSTVSNPRIIQLALKYNF
jgi:carboxypeptidase family protein/TonB-dependent receptor-like protein